MGFGALTSTVLVIVGPGDARLGFAAGRGAF
jgi:hypothetical protein